MQLEAKVVELTITHIPNDCVRVELIVYRPRYDRWVFTLAERAKDEENEKEYQRLIEAYEHYEQ